MRAGSIKGIAACLLVVGSLTGVAHGDALPSPLATKGNQIVGPDGKPVRLVSVGMWPGSVDPDKMQQIADAGFNTVRIDWSNRATNRLHQLDRLIAAAGAAGLKVILDDHSNEGGAPGPWKPCYAQQQNGLWYDRGGASNNTDGCSKGSVTDAKFVHDWETVARRYVHNSTVIGYDLWNEPLGYPGMSTWEPGDRNPDHNIRWMYERIGNAILQIDSTKLIICEGPLNMKSSTADPNNPAPWGDLSVAGKYPVRLSNEGKLVYSVHDYPANIGGYRPDSGPLKVAQMNKAWGYLVRDDIAPVWVGEAGSNMNSPEDARWAETLISYANGEMGKLGGPSFGPGQQGIGVSWWFAGYQPGGKPEGIFTPTGQIEPRQHSIYSQFRPRIMSNDGGKKP
jgi:endoglucanase